MRWALLAFFAAGLLPCRLSAATITEVHYVMGTYFRITAEDPDAQHARVAMRECFAIARQVDRRFSRFDPSSELSQLNATAAKGEPAVVSADMAALLRRALDLRAATDGTFDVSVGALTQLWRTATDWPSRSSIEAARQADSTRSLQLVGTTLFRKPGVLLDFDGIAKGWTVDRCVTRLRAAGVDRALLNFGESSLFAIGAPKPSSGWEVSLRGLDGGTVIGALSLRDEAVSVSSVFGHARRVGSRRVGHIVDPRSGQALTAPALALVVAASATDAEAFSKALLIEPLVRAPASLVGTVLVTPKAVRRTGRVAFRSFKKPKQIAVTAEALR